MLVVVKKKSRFITIITIKSKARVFRYLYFSVVQTSQWQRLEMRCNRSWNDAEWMIDYSKPQETLMECVVAFGKYRLVNKIRWHKDFGSALGILFTIEPINTAHATCEQKAFDASTRRKLWHRGAQFQKVAWLDSGWCRLKSFSNKSQLVRVKNTTP